MVGGHLSDRVQDGLGHRKEGLTMLQFNYQGLHKLPEELFTDPAFRHIEKIHLKGNRLKHLPDAIGTLTNLTELYLPSNDLECLPASIGELKQLESLDLSGNKLTSLPDSLICLQRLASLIVSNNNIQHLPPGMKNLKNLAVLDLMNNHLKRLPREVTECTGLRRLCVDRNQLSWLPRQLCGMLNLEEISVAGNNLLCVPPDLGTIPKLKTVYLDNNRQLTAIPLSLRFCQVGVNSCGTRNFIPSHYDRTAPLTLTLGEKDDGKVICLPPEMVEISKRDSPVASLLELTLRRVYEQKPRVQLSELPVNLQLYIQQATASCFLCGCPMFTTGFPMVFAAHIQTHRTYYLCFCCDSRCVHALATSNSAPLPLVYPDLGLSLALRV